MNKKIDILRVTSLRGPNLWTYGPVLELLIDIGELEDFPSDRIPGFPERLAAWMPSLVEHRCSYDARGGFLRRMQEGTWPGHIVEHVALELQTLAGMRGGFGRTRETSRRGVYKLVVTSWHDDVTLVSVKQACDMVLCAMDDRPYDMDAAVQDLRRMGDDLCLGPSTTAIVLAAEARKIPAIRLNDGNLVQLGYGRRARRIWTAETDRTSAIAEGISRDKSLTKQLLQSCGVPIPEGRPVDDAADAWAAAEEIGVPVVVKPIDGNHGRGVFLGLTTREEVEAAYPIAKDEGSGVIVERFVRGDEHRLLVVGGRMVAAARGEAAFVTGDGRSTVLELIESQLNSDPRRGNTQDHPLNLVRIDSAVRVELLHQNLTAESVPEAGVRVLIQRNGNMSLDVTDEVHPDVAARVALAARIVGLDIAGIDLVAEDISRPLGPQRGAVVEVNAGPGLQFHLRPTRGPGRPVGEAIVDNLFGEGDDGRIPVVGVAGCGRTAMASHRIAHLLNLAGQCTGLACGDAVLLDQRPIQTAARTPWARGQQLLMNRTVEVAVIENGLHSILTEGLAYDRCQVGVVMDLDRAVTVPDFFIEDEDDLFRVLRTQVDVVLPGGAAVLDVDDPLIADMARLCDGEVIFFGIDPGNPVLAAHLAAGGRAVLLQDSAVVAVAGAESVPTAELPPAVVSAGNGEVAAHLAAAAAAWALGLPLDLIRTGLETFDPARPSGSRTR